MLPQLSLASAHSSPPLQWVELAQAGGTALCMSHCTAIDLSR
jgi:hypothetical protein